MRTFIFCISLLFYCFAQAQSLKFRPLTTKEGLSNNSVNDIVSDASGRLWIATWDGLNIYDGHRVEVFKHKIGDSTSIAGNMVSKFVVDASHTIWMLTDNKGVSKYIGNGKFQNFYFKVQPDNIFLSKNGFPALQLESSYLEIRENKIKEIEKTSIVQNPINKSLYNILKAKYPNVVINDILQDKEGDIWYATRNDGLYILSGNINNVNSDRIQHYIYDLYAPHTFTSNEIEILYEDDFKNIWMGHKDGGLSMAYKGSKQITTITPHPVKYPHLPNETLRAVTKDLENSLWLGYYTKGLFYFDREEECFVSFPIKEAASNFWWNRIRSLFTAEDGSIWAGTYAGIIKIEGSKYTLYEAEKVKLLPNGRNYSIVQNGQYLWIACWNGVAKYDLKRSEFVPVNYGEKLLSYHIRHILADDKLLLLATETNDVIVFDTETGAVKQLDVLGSSIYHIAKDEQTGYYWIAALGGITVYDLNSGIVKNFTEAEGLPSHMVYSLVKNKETFWISTTKGLAAINSIDYSIYKLPKEQGWQGEEFSEGAFYQDKKRVLYYGGINGLSYFQPGSYTVTNPAPKIKLYVDGDENFEKHIEKKHSKNSIEIKLIPVVFQTTHQKVFYKLEGYNEDWMPYVSSDIKYENIPTGNYELLVKTGTGKEQIQSMFSLRIKKAFYQLWWFYMLILIFLGLGTFLYMLKKHRLTKQRALNLEQKVTDRTVQINAQKKSLEHMNNILEEKKEELLKIHQKLKNKDFEIEKFKTFVLSEFKTPLSKIALCANDFDSSDKLKTELTKETTKLIETVTQWDYLDHIKKIGALNITRVAFDRLVENLTEQFSLNALNNTVVKFDDHINSKKTIFIDVLRFKLLFQYLLNNLFKYIESESTLWLSFFLNEKEIVLHIKSDSLLLKDEWHEVKEYEAYYRAFKNLLHDLNGTIERDDKTSFALRLQIPVLTTEVYVNKKTEIIYLKTAEEQQENNHLKKILILCKEDDAEIVQQFLNDETYLLVFESDPHLIIPALNQQLFVALVLYNTYFNNSIVQLLEKIRDLKIPKVYISEKISVLMREQAMELNLDSMLFMPISPSFVKKEMERLLTYYKQDTYGETYRMLFNTNKKDSLSPQEKLVKEAMDIVKEELSNTNFNVDKLITRLSISRTKCYRAFKEVLDKSPSDVIIGLRMQKATYLLKNKHLNVSEVSYPDLSAHYLFEKFTFENQWFMKYFMYFDRTNWVKCYTSEPSRPRVIPARSRCIIIEKANGLLSNISVQGQPRLKSLSSMK